VVDFVASCNDKWERGISVVESLQQFVEQQMKEYTLYDGVKQSVMFRDIAVIAKDWLSEGKVSGRSKDILTAIYGAAKLRAFVDETQVRL